jgi:hypothetical protein
VSRKNVSHSANPADLGVLTFQPVPQCPVCELHRHLYGATPAERLFLILKAALEVTEKAGTMPAAFTLAVGASELLFIWRPDTDWKYASARAPPASIEHDSAGIRRDGKHHPNDLDSCGRFVDTW